MAKKFSIGIVIKAIDKATSVFNGIGDGANRAGKRITAFGKGWSTNVSAPVAALSGLSFKANLDFENAMDKLLTQTDASAEQVAAWKDQILRDAPDMGVAPLSLAEGLLAAVSAGEQGARAYDTMRQAAKGEALQLGRTAELVNMATGITENYGKANLSTAEALSILLATINQGKGEAADLAPVMGPSISMAQALGISFDQVGAAIAAFTVKSIPAAQAATQIEGILRNLNKITPASAKEFKRLGYTYGGLQKSLQEKGLYETLLDINKAAKGQKQVLATLFPDTQAYAGVIQLVNDEGGKMKTTFDAVRAHAVTMDDAMAKIKGGAGQESRKNMAALSTASIQFGSALSVFLVPALTMATGALTKAGKWFKSLSPGMQRFITGAVLAAVVIGPLLIALGAVVTVGGVFAGIIGAVGAALAAVTAPVWLIAAGVGLLIGAVVWAIKDWKGFLKALSWLNPFKQVKALLDALSNWLFGMDFTEAGSRMINSIWDGMKAGWGAVKSWFKGALADLLDMLPGFMKPTGLISGLKAGAAPAAGAPAPGFGGDGRPSVPPGPSALRAGIDAARRSPAMVPWKQPEASKADVTVEFRGAPAGTRVTGKANKGMKLNLDTGYAMAN